MISPSSDQLFTAAEGNALHFARLSEETECCRRKWRHCPPESCHNNYSVTYILVLLIVVFDVSGSNNIPAIAFKSNMIQLQIKSISTIKFHPLVNEIPTWTIALGWRDYLYGFGYTWKVILWFDDYSTEIFIQTIFTQQLNHLT